MGKNLYSLLLDDEVVAAIDRLALSRAMSRSAMANAILAEYAEVLTPEERINRIFRKLDELMGDNRDIVPMMTENRPTMALKSSLAYKYRPTIRYEVELFRAPEGDIGEISVIFRTTSAVLTEAVTAFFRLWCRLENTYLSPLGRGEITYEMTGGRLRRRIRPQNPDPDTLSRQLADYITMLDDLMKKTICGELDENQLEKKYVACLNRGIGLL